jgi:hypothetical protein
VLLGLLVLTATLLSHPDRNLGSDSAKGRYLCLGTASTHLSFGSENLFGAVFAVIFVIRV